MRALRRSSAIILIVIAGLVGVACSSDDGGSSATTATTAPGSGVGVRTASIVSDAAPVVGSPVPGGREFPATVFYPSSGVGGTEPVVDASPDVDGGPYPLIVFSHGLGGSPEQAQEMLASWAAAGYVVAAPAFPKTSAAVAEAIDPGDYVNQPGDVSAVITALLDASTEDGAPLTGMVDGSRVGVAGHSLGGVTTVGASVHTCCRDERIDAAVVMAADPLGFPNGALDYGAAPPLLLVHGTEDDLIPYDSSVDAFNDALAPKGLLTIEGGDHLSPLDPTGPAFDTVAATTVDFFDGYLRGDANAIARLAAGGSTEFTNLVFVAEPGSQVTIPTGPEEPARDLVAAVTPDAGLVNGQMVTVTWSGFTPGNTINIVQCSNRVAGDASACDLQKGLILQPNPTGSGSLPLEIVVGPVGSGVCDATTPDCQIVVNDGGSVDPAASVRISISFAS